MWILRKVASICSLSTSETLLTTSTRTPTSMFINIRVANRMKSKMSMPLIASSLAMSFTNSAKSGSVPRSSSVFQASTKVGKNFLPIRVPSVSCLNAMAKTYTIQHKRHSVKNTDRAAPVIPLMSIISSGIAVNSFAIRAILLSLKRRNTFSTETLPKASGDETPSIKTMSVSTHVSPTISNASALSNTNHVSPKQWIFLRNAKKRTIHSATK
mmetsp:Transcript_15772/g.28746  ORF Transcript_15772/g.28746 Transcript_15772/m.28746 type:complete len:213 (+) Transcript_15772:314-952(+)